MICNPCFHCRGNSQGFMHAAEIVIREVQGNSGFQIVQLFRESISELVQLYGPFYRLDANAQAIADSQMLFGTPARNIYASDTASVKAYFGTLPEGKPGLEFYTSEKPSSIGSGTQGAQVWWYGPKHSDLHFIPIAPSRVVPPQ